MPMSWMERFFERLKNGDEKQRPQPPAPPPPPTPPPPKNWCRVAGISVGAKHLRAYPPVPCQDAALARAVRPCAVVADGAGSAALSHFGAQQAVLRLSHLVAALEDLHVANLDSPEPADKKAGTFYARRLIIHAFETLRALAAEHEKVFKQFHCTLLVVIVGATRSFWMKVGDGHIVQEQNGELKIVGVVGKEGPANVTNFVCEIPQQTKFNAGLVESADISGWALMTDGAAEKLVSHDGKQVAGKLSEFFVQMREGKFAEKELHSFLSNPEIWKPPGYTGDDKGMALLAQMPPPPEAAAEPPPADK